MKVLILNALGFKPHPTHFNLTQALEAAETLKPERTILTHINHHFDFEKVSRDLPEGVELALDGMQIEIEPGKGKSSRDNPLPAKQSYCTLPPAARRGLVEIEILQRFFAGSIHMLC